MSRASIERRLLDISDRIKKASADLAVTDEQLSFLDEEAEDDAPPHAIVAETPMEVATANEAARHADALRRHRDALLRSIGELRTEQDELLDRMTAEPAPALSIDERKPVSTERTRVVVAEDEAIIRLDLKELLEEEGFDVVGETGRGDEAVELVRSLQPDLAILDIKMPGLDGLSAARQITSERLAAVLILTAFSQRDLVEQARDAGAMSYIVKPFQKSDLIPAIELSLGRHAEMRSLESEIGDLAERLEARKIIDRAKGVLMDQYDLSEAQSWEYIRTEAMNRRTKVHEIAAQVVAGDLAPSESV